MKFKKAMWLLVFLILLVPTFSLALNSFSNLEAKSLYADVVFSGQVESSMTKNDLLSTISIDKNKVEVSHPDLKNIPATIRFKFTSMKNPIVLRNGIWKSDIKPKQIDLTTWEITVPYWSVYELVDMTWNGTFDDMTVYQSGLGRLALARSPDTVLLYPFNLKQHSKGHTHDTSGLLNDGNIEGRAYRVEVQVEDGLVFSEGNDYVFAEIVPPQGNQTYMAWVCPNVIDRELGVFSFAEDAPIGAAGAWDRSLIVQADSKVYFKITNAAGTVNTFLTSTDVIPILECSHLAVTINDTQAVLYINGTVQDADVAQVGYAGYATPNFLVGNGKKQGSTTAFFQGQIDEVRVFSKYMTPTDILNIYLNESNGTYNTHQVDYSNMLLHYTFDDYFREVPNDLSAYNNNGTVGGYHTYKNDDGYSAHDNGDCIIDNCTRFDGTDDYLRPYRPLSCTHNTTFSITAWFKANQSLGINQIISQDDDFKNRTVQLRLDDDGTIRFTKFNKTGGNNSIFSPGSYKKDQWTFVVAVYDSSVGQYLYVNGERVALDGSTYAKQQANTSQSTDCLIGARHSTSVREFFNGTLDEVKVYYSALNETTIKNMYLAESFKENPVNNSGRTPTTISTSEWGVYNAGNAASVATVGDGDCYNVSEVGLTPGFLIYFNFTSVTFFDRIRVRGYYEGNPAHNIQLLLYNQTHNAWSSFGLITDEDGFAWYNFSIIDYNNYRSGTGLVMGAINHTTLGVPGHEICLDYIELSSRANQSLIHNYKMNEPTGIKIADSSNNTRSLNMINYFRPYWNETGRIDNPSYWFNGQSVINFNCPGCRNDTITSCAWIYPESITDGKRVVVASGNLSAFSTINWVMEKNNANLVIYGDTASVQANNVITAKQWQHVCFVNNKTHTEIYRNNISVLAPTPHTINNYNTVGETVGGDGLSNLYRFNGSIDSVYIYDKTKTKAQINEIMTNDNLTIYLMEGSYTSEIHNTSEFDPAIVENTWYNLTFGGNADDISNITVRGGNCTTLTAQAWTQATRTNNLVTWGTPITGHCFQWYAKFEGNESGTNLIYNYTLTNLRHYRPNVTDLKIFPVTVTGADTVFGNATFTLNDTDSGNITFEWMINNSIVSTKKVQNLINGSVATTNLSGLFKKGQVLSFNATADYAGIYSWPYQSNNLTVSNTRINISSFSPTNTNFSREVGSRTTFSLNLYDIDNDARCYWRADNTNSPIIQNGTGTSFSPSTHGFSSGDLIIVYVNCTDDQYNASQGWWISLTTPLFSSAEYITESESEVIYVRLGHVIHFE